MIFLLVLFFLAGCDFKPLYERKEDYIVLPSKIVVKGGENNAFYAYKFKKELALHLEHIACCIDEKEIKISINLNISFGDIGYGSDLSILRSSARAVAILNIFDNKGKLVYENNLDAVSSYTLEMNEEFSKMSAAEANNSRIIMSLAQDVAVDIKRYLANI